MIFYIADLHVEFEIFGYLTGADHGVVFFGFGLFKALEVGGFGFAEHAFDFGVVLEIRPFHLAHHKRTGERHLSDVVTGRGFDGHEVADCERKVQRIAEESLAGVFKLHFDDVAGCLGAGNVGQPVVAEQFAARRSIAAGLTPGACAA